MFCQHAYIFCNCSSWIRRSECLSFSHGIVFSICMRIICDKLRLAFVSNPVSLFLLKEPTFCVSFFSAVLFLLHWLLPFLHVRKSQMPAFCWFLPLLYVLEQKESNARLLEWSNAELQLQVGKEYFNIDFNAIDKESNYLYSELNNDTWRGLVCFLSGFSPFRLPSNFCPNPSNTWRAFQMSWIAEIWWILIYSILVISRRRIESQCYHNQAIFRDGGLSYPCYIFCYFGVNSVA